jgi:hypothetical protein
MTDNRLMKTNWQFLEIRHATLALNPTYSVRTISDSSVRLFTYNVSSCMHRFIQWSTGMGMESRMEYWTGVLEAMMSDGG